MLHQEFKRWLWVWGTALVLVLSIWGSFHEPAAPDSVLPVQEAERLNAPTRANALVQSAPKRDDHLKHPVALPVSDKHIVTHSRSRFEIVFKHRM